MSDESTWYQQWKSNFYKSCGNRTEGAVTNGSIASGGNWTVSEGMGYGIVLAVGNNDQTTFNALWASTKQATTPTTS